MAETRALSSEERLELEESFRDLLIRIKRLYVNVKQYFAHHPHVRNSAKFTRRILSEVQLIDSLIENPSRMTPHLYQSSSVPLLETIYSVIVHEVGVVSVLTMFSTPHAAAPATTSTGAGFPQAAALSVEVDVVSQLGCRWVKVKAMRMESLRGSMSGASRGRPVFEILENIAEVASTRPMVEAVMAIRDPRAVPLPEDLYEELMAVTDGAVDIVDYSTVVGPATADAVACVCCGPWSPPARRADSDTATEPKNEEADTVLDFLRCSSALNAVVPLYHTIPPPRAQPCRHGPAPLPPPSERDNIDACMAIRLSRPPCGGGPLNASQRYSGHNPEIANSMSLPLCCLSEAAPCLAGAPLFLDVTTMAAFCSDLTNKVVDPDLFQPFPVLSSQASSEIDLCCAHLLGNFLRLNAPHHPIFICMSAATDFMSIVRTVGGPRERARAEKLMAAVKIVPDAPSEELEGVPITSKVTPRNAVIFGTSYTHHGIILTANMSFLSACRQLGVHLLAFLHPSRALVEQKVGVETWVSPKTGGTLQRTSALPVVRQSDTSEGTESTESMVCDTVGDARIRKQTLFPIVMEAIGVSNSVLREITGT